MKKLKEVLKFLSGFQTAHLISHIYLQLASSFPRAFDLKIIKITITSTFNLVAIAANAVILFLLVYFAWRQEK